MNGTSPGRTAPTPSGVAERPPSRPIIALATILMLGGALAATTAARAEDAPAPPADPMRPPGAEPADPAATVAGPAALCVSAIFHFSKQWVAVINGRAVVIGDHIARAEIVNIDKEGVAYRRGGQLHLARLRRGFGLRSADGAGESDGGDGS